MGAVVVHNANDEAVVLRDALVLIWDALEEGYQTEAELCAAVSPVDDASNATVEAVHQALEALQEVGLAERRE